MPHGRNCLQWNRINYDVFIFGQNTEPCRWNNDQFLQTYNTRHHSSPLTIITKLVTIDTLDGLYHSIHWDRVTHICVRNLTIIGPGKGLSPGRRRAITRPNATLLSFEPLGTNLNEILIEINNFSLKKLHLKMSSAKWRLFHLGLTESSSASAISVLHTVPYYI